MGCAVPVAQKPKDPPAPAAGDAKAGAGPSRELPPPGSSNVRPSYWTTANGVAVFPAPELLPRAQELLTKTWRQTYTRDRAYSDAGGRVPSGGRVLNVLRVENHAAFSAYHAHLLRVKSARASGQLRHFPVPTDGFLMQEALQRDVNEMYLWHGTSPEAADAIAKNDFNLDLTGKGRGAMFGPGIYLAENSSKSDEYARQGSGIFIGQCALLLCRAVAGKVLTVEHAADHSSAVLSGSYDSVCGDREAAVGTFREMVFFNPCAVYCEYVVLYARDFEDVLAPSTPAPAVPCPAPVASNEVVESVEPEPGPTGASPFKTFQAFDNSSLAEGFTSRPQPRFAEDVPAGCRLGRCMEYVKSEQGPRPWQWYGWNVNLPGAWFRVSCWIKFVGKVPGPSANFGFKIHGQTDNSWLRKASADEWIRITTLGNNTNGDHNWVLLIFDSLQEPQVVRFTDLTLEAFRGCDAPAETTYAAFDSENLVAGFATPGGVHFSTDVPDGCNLARSMEYIKTTKGRQGGQWYGWQVARPGVLFRVSCQIKFLEKVPPRSSNFGLKIHGKVDNSWLTHVVPGKWAHISSSGASTHGDSNWILLIFDSIEELQTVRFTDLKLEVLDMDKVKVSGLDIPASLHAAVSRWALWAFSGS